MLMGSADLLLLFNLTESGPFGSPACGCTPGAVAYTNFAFFVGGWSTFSLLVGRLVGGLAA